MDYIDLRECNEVAGETFDLPSVETTARAGNSTADEALFKVYPVLDNGFVRLVDYMGGDHSIVRAARVSYGQGTKSVSDGKGLIDYLIRHRHTSPLEFVDLAFQVRCPIFVMRQWIRHRTACLTGDEICHQP
jgi:thymidylate synthase (FAD)